MHEEDAVTHVLWSYPAASDVWVEIDSLVQKWLSDGEDFTRMWKKMTQVFKRDRLEKIATIMYNIWNKKSRFIFEDKFMGPKMVMKAALANLDEFQKTK